MKKLLLTLSLALVAILANAASTVYLKIDGTTVTDGGTWCCYYWGGAQNTWPGTQMTKSETAANDGSYYFTITIDTDDTYNIIFTQFEGTWQTGDIKNQKGDVAYSLDSSKNATSVAVPTWGTTPDPEPEADPVTIYLQVDGTYVKNDAAPNCYAWIDSNQLLGAWPGAAMTLKKEAADDGNYYFTISVPNNAAEFNLIFDLIFNNVQDKKTVDITEGGNATGAAYKLTGEDNNMYTYSKLEAVPTWKNSMTIVGEGASWNGNQFKKTDEGYVLQLEGTDLDQLGDPGFVINCDGTSISSGSELTVGRGNGSEGDYVNMTEGNEEKMTATLNSGDDSVFIYVKNEDGQWKIYVTSYSTSGVNAVNASDVKISANAGEIVVEGAQKVAVYTVGGALLSTDARTEVAKGLYIVRAGNQVKKVIVK